MPTKSTYAKAAEALADGRRVTALEVSKVCEIEKYNAKPLPCLLIVQTATLATAQEAHRLGVPKDRITVKPSAASSCPAASDVQHESES